MIFRVFINFPTFLTVSCLTTDYMPYKSIQTNFENKFWSIFSRSQPLPQIQNTFLAIYIYSKGFLAHGISRYFLEILTPNLSLDVLIKLFFIKKECKSWQYKHYACLLFLGLTVSRCRLWQDTLFFYVHICSLLTRIDCIYGCHTNILIP